MATAYEVDLHKIRSVKRKSAAKNYKTQSKGMIES